MKLGLDIGSTTIKYVVLNEHNEILEQKYERHYAQIVPKTIEILRHMQEEYPQQSAVQLTISGSAGMGIADSCHIPFMQEVYATRVASKAFTPGTDVIIELGGEDAKILFLTGGTEVRMNGSCAGGTGAFIDQMATLLQMAPSDMNELAGQSDKIYTIASRCGVFAKSDIQPLLNQGARKPDICASIFHAVVNQTIAGLAQGRPIQGNVLYLGGPLTFLSNLRKSFDETLGTTGLCPENSLYFVALGAALSSEEAIDLQNAIQSLEHYKSVANYHTIPPLFESQEQYDAFAARHARNTVPTRDPKTYQGGAYLGIDAGSTTLKLVVISEQNEILLQQYQPNNGNPVPIIKAFLEDFYQNYPNIHLLSSAVTGYGEEIVQNAFGVDFGIVETMAHFTAAKEFMPDVDFIIDIGGQDIKCFQIKNGAIDNLFLNEACSSGCGSFLQTFANALGFSIEEFARRGLFAEKPVDLGSRCTVFMNSSVKQAQKDGASIENISAGLSVSVVKNALYKVIRASKGQMQGLHIVVQGGTFLNDAVLRAFEQELDVEVVRPAIAGLMGAFGAALYAKSKKGQTSGLLGPQELKDFEHTVKVVTCGLCQNHCRLTVNSFGGGRKFIGGNRCERPITKKASGDELDIYAYKLSLLQSYQPIPGLRGKIGIPMGLNMFELLPFWHAFWTRLGFEVVYSPLSNRELYLLGQATIPSDTVCFPAKLMHGHVQTLVNQGIERIFYPCMTYNLDEHLGDNHYNCPVVAYYPEVIGANMPDVADILFIHDYLGLHRQKDFPKKAWQNLIKYFPDITLDEVKLACKAAFAEYHAYFAKVKQKGEEIIEKARAQGLPIVVLAGRPYHVDPEINHGIDKLVLSCKAAVISEDVIADRVEKFKTHVLNQWTYHSRLYAAAKYVTTQKDMQLVQLVSFGCGVDAITTDEVREILESGGKIYTQIKIDEITNLGAVKIRLRSLFAAIGL